MRATPTILLLNEGGAKERGRLPFEFKQLREELADEGRSRASVTSRNRYSTLSKGSRRKIFLEGGRTTALNPSLVILN